MSHAHGGELRSLLASPTQENWSALCELLAAWDDLDALRELTLRRARAKSFADVLTDTYPGAMRANVLAAAQYLTHGLKLAPTSWTISGGTHAQLVHHGALRADLRRRPRGGA